MLFWIIALACAVAGIMVKRHAEAERAEELALLRRIADRQDR